MQFIKKNYLVIFLTIISFIFYTINLKGSLGFFDDTARDTIKALEIIQQKKITLIGPPLSFGLFTIREVYFGSLSLYIAIIGLLIGNLNVEGAIYPTIFFFTISIYFFYRLVKYLSTSKKTQIISTVIYALSPATITFARFFWNPNLIIPFSVFFWLLILQNYASNKKKLLGYLIAGIIGGLMVNFHYVSLAIIFFCLFYLVFKRKILLSLVLFLGFLIGSLPLIIFELKHQFYLSQALIYNFNHRGVAGEIGNKLTHFFSGILVILGLKPSEISHPTVSLSQFLIYLVIIVIFYLMIKSFLSLKKDKKVFLVPLLLMNLVAVFMSKQIYNIHYLFPVYPLLVWYIGHLLTQIKIPKIEFIIISIMLYSSLLIPYDVHNIKKDYLSVNKIEEIASYIVKDNPRPPYNITENITGGAQGIPFRYVLERDAKVKINSKESYMDLKTLYVVTNNINKTYKENRWEFSATPNKKLIDRKSVV